MVRRPPRSTLFPDTTLSRSVRRPRPAASAADDDPHRRGEGRAALHLARRGGPHARRALRAGRGLRPPSALRSEEHTSELQSRQYLVCRLLLEKKNDTERKRT